MLPPEGPALRIVPPIFRIGLLLLSPLQMLPPYVRAELPVRVLLMIVSVCTFQMPPPSPSNATLWPVPAELPLKVVLLIVMIPPASLRMPPPNAAELPLKVLLIIATVEDAAKLFVNYEGIN